MSDPIELPRDPMWRRFRELRPDVTLVLVPDVPVGEAEAIPEADADAESAEVVRLARETALTLGIEPDAEAGRASVAPGVVRPTAEIRAPAGGHLAESTDTLVLRLERLGWQAVARPAPDVVWIDARADGRSLRLTVVDDRARIEVRGRKVQHGADGGDADG